MKRATAKSEPAIDQLEDVFKALADKTRLRILALLGNNEVCVCHIHDSLGVAAADGLAPPGVPAANRAGRRSARRRVDALPGGEVARPGASSACVNAAVDALTSVRDDQSRIASSSSARSGSSMCSTARRWRSVLRAADLRRASMVIEAADAIAIFRRCAGCSSASTCRSTASTSTCRRWSSRTGRVADRGSGGAWSCTPTARSCDPSPSIRAVQGRRLGHRLTEAALQHGAEPRS